MGLEDLTLDPDSTQPAYQQIGAAVVADVDSGRLPAGARLPAIRRLATRLGIHRDTVALAYEQLARAGWVDAQVGRGTFVADRPGQPLVDAGDSAPAARTIDAEPRTPAPPAGEIMLATQVERLISLENTRPRYATGDDVVPLHRLVPDPALYPVEAFRACLDAALDEEGAALFSYASPEGDPALRGALAERFQRQGIARSSDELVLCHGASQGISLALRLFAAPGESIAVEVPTYANVLSACAGLGLGVVPVAMDADGPDPALLERVLAKPDVKAFYTIPSFHNPLGTTTSAARRQALLAVAAAAGKPIVEDGFEMDLRFRGSDVPPLAALEEHGQVVLLSSFSKSLFPGIRVGAISARGRALEGLAALKHATDLSDALPMQAALARFLMCGDYDRHLERIRAVLRVRHAAMDEALRTSMPPGTRWTEPDGGYQRWVELPFEVDTRDLLTDAARAGVLFSPGTLFEPEGRPSRAMRLAVCGADEGEIRRGVAALGRVVTEASRSGPRRTAEMHL